MEQIITGPFGRVAYHNAARVGAGQYPALNIPSRDFARGEMPVAANTTYALHVVPLFRRQSAGAALAITGMAFQREN
jgi:hypothetical protein